jgi:thioredoxin-like negative regulator of GroEL
VAVQDLTRETFQELVGDVDGRVVIDFWGPRCAPCLALAPKYYDLAQEYGNLTFLRVEAPKNRMLCVDLRVMSLPTFLCLEGGQEVARLDGDISESDLATWIRGQTERDREEARHG